MSANKIVCFKHIYDCNQGRIQDVTGGGGLDLFENKKNKDLGRKRRKIYIFPVFALDFLSLSAIDKLF